ncbi:MAG: OmpA family protein [Methylocella sp.]
MWIATSHAVRVKGMVFNAAATEQLGQGKIDTLAFGDLETSQLHVAVVEIKPKAKEFLVFFDLDKATLTSEATKTIADAAKRAKAIGAQPINVTGHTDRSGTEQHNAKLSVRRAEAVKTELVKLGISATAIVVEGKGEQDPLVPTPDGVAEARNRRASIAIPLDKFPTGTLLSYDLILELVGRSGKTRDSYLVSAQTSNDKGNALAYEGYSYPTFFINRDNLNILHGSCRKAHGAGDDALACADSLLQQTAADPTKRPSALFLTGDQIYADDVHDALIKPASELGRRLLGFDEILPTLSAPVHTLPPLLRRLLVAKYKIFSPDKDAQNHLLGFGDFTGLYLLALNDALWPERLKPPSDDLERFRHALAAVRRALANIATYMIMDDHEVTDDWNLSNAWEERALRNPLGRRVITHALCAYWVFQGWGNEPLAFADDFRKTVTDYFAGHERDGTALESLLLATHPWFFVAPTTPPAFFLDSRTRRAANMVRPDGPPALMDDDALRDFYTEATSRQISSNWLVVIAATPVFGNPDLERFLEDRGFTAPEENDLEMWHANRQGYYNFLRKVIEIKPRGCVILSGDVHYGFVARAVVTANGTTVRFTQFTSSALKNKVTGRAAPPLAVARTQANFVNEQGWLSKPKYTRPSASKRVREILAASPTTVTLDEFLEAGVVGKADTTILNRPIRPTTPSDGFFLHTQTNLGQLLLTPGGDATLRFYTPNNTPNKKDPFATYTLRLDAPP